MDLADDTHAPYVMVLSSSIHQSISDLHCAQPQSIFHNNLRLTVRLLEPGPCTVTAELLWLAPSVVCYEESTVVLHECLLELVLAVLVDVFLVVGDL